jgi:sortase B
MEWKVFACVLFNTQEKYGDVYRYWDKTEFANENEFNDFILNIMARNVLFTDVDLEYGDRLLTLSTCYFPYERSVDTRCVVFARQVRPGESSVVDTSKAFYNTYVFRFKEERRRIGHIWSDEKWNNGEIWDFKKYLKSYNGETIKHNKDKEILEIIR